MQIATIYKLQRALDTSVKVLRFVWRHALTLVMFSILVDILYEGNTPFIEREILVFAMAAFLDWFKMKWKLSSTNNYKSSTNTSFTQANYWNSSIVGTTAYLSNLGHRY